MNPSADTFRRLSLHRGHPPVEQHDPVSEEDCWSYYARPVVHTICPPNVGLLDLGKKRVGRGT